MSDKTVIALDLGGTKLAAALFTADGRPELKQSTPLDGRTGDAVGRLITQEVNRLRRAAAELGKQVLGVGVAVPGIANSKTGRVWAPNIPGWEDYPLKDEIRAAIGDQRINVAVGSDRAACILGEAWHGAARDCRDAIFIAVGTGIGAGILADGHVLEGAHGIAGAIGWWALNPEFRDEYRHWGCFESHASGEGLVRAWSGKGHDGEKSSTRELFEAYERGDHPASGVLQDAIKFWGMATANLVSVFNPEKIIFGGGVFGPATRFLNAIADEAARWAQPVAFKRVSIEASQLGGDAALYGAAALARSGGF